MNNYACIAVFWVALFGTFAVNSYMDDQVKIEQASALQECYKAAQVNTRLVCQK